MDVENDALIAQALWAEENYQEYGAFAADEGNDTDDSDYGSATRKKKGKAARAPPAKRGCKCKAAAPTSVPAAPSAAGAADATTSNADQAAAPQPNHATAAAAAAAPHNASEDDVADGGRRKRKDAGQPREKGRAWTDQEETLFLEALTLYGRDWKRCAEHVGSRDSKAISSHMQKHLIKLCVAGAPLPPKVAESGLGYTLSGKLLDPASSAARAYGFKPELIQRLTGAQLETALAGIQQEGLPLTDATNSSKDASAQDGQALPTAKAAPARQPKRQKLMQDDSSAALPAANAGSAPARAGASATATAAGTTASHDDDAAPAPVLQTEYARNRPRREMAGQRLATLGDTSESLDMIKCCDFVGPAGSGMALAQPFTVGVAMEAMVTMEVHAHLSSCEIIGLLGGTWDASTRVLCVAEAHPCRRAAGSDARTSVELDAEAEVEARARMDEAGQTCVGWYHSHPVFEPCPSQKDCDNQRNYQALLRDHESKVEPFIGIILGPYDLAMPRPHTAITAFVVQQKTAGLQPYNIRYTMQGRDAAPSACLRPKLTALLEQFREDIGRIDFASAWRPFTSIAGGAVSGPPCSKLAKLASALRHQLTRAPAWQVDQFLSWLCKQIQECWLVNLSAAMLPKQSDDSAADAAAPTAADGIEAAPAQTALVAPVLDAGKEGVEPEVNEADEAGALADADPTAAACHTDGSGAAASDADAGQSGAVSHTALE